MTAAFDDVLRRSGLLFGLQVANVALAYASQILLARWLGDVQFGVFAYAWAWANVLAVPAGLGLSTAVLRFVPTYLEHNDRPHLHAFVRWSTRTVLVAGLAVGGVGSAIAYAARHVLPAYYILPLAIAFAAVPLLALSTLRINQANSFGKPAVAYLPWVIGSTIGLIAGAAVLIRVGVHVDASMVLAVALVALVAIVAVQARALWALLPKCAARGHAQPRAWLRVSAPLLMSALLYVLLERADLVLVGTLLGPREAGIYGAAARTALLASFGTIAITTLATPRIATLHANGARADLQTFATDVSRWTFWPAVAAALLLVVLGGPILSLFGPAFREGWTCLALLAIAQVVPASVGLAPHLLNMTGYQVSGAAAMAVALVVCLCLGVILIPRMGITGAALATASAMIVRSFGHAFLVRRRLGLETFAMPATEARTL